MSNTSTKRVLLITYYFPPDNKTGAFRAALFSKFLPKFGWEPIILRVAPKKECELDKKKLYIDGLPLPKNIYNLKYDEHKKNRLYNKLYLINHSMKITSYKEKIIEDITILRKKRIHAIWATSPPITVLEIASKLSKLLKVPWVADFRDIEEQDFWRDKSLKMKIYKIKSIFWRCFLIKSASKVIAVSRYHSLILKRHTFKKTQVIYNGFEKAMYSKVIAKTSEKFILSSLGGMYDKINENYQIAGWYYNPSPFLEAFNSFLKEENVKKDDIELKFYGVTKKIFDELCPFSLIKESVQVFPAIPYKKLPEVLKQSTLLLLFLNHRPGVITTKVFDYLGAKRPILRTPGKKDELDLLLSKTKAGISLSDPPEIIEYLKKAYNEWKEKGTLRYRGIDQEVGIFTREKQAENLASLLGSILKK
jgi:glycosyltransferase involved in cell wall biosynthesis